MDDDIQPIQPVGSTPPVRTLAAIRNFHRHVGMKLALVIERFQKAAD